MPKTVAEEAARISAREARRTLVSSRGFDIVRSRPSGSDESSAPYVTVELACKWYFLLVVRPQSGGVYVEEIIFPTEADAPGPPYVDHVPNPDHVRAFCSREGLDLDPLAEELMEGRWRLDGPRAR